MKHPCEGHGNDGKCSGVGFVEISTIFSCWEIISFETVPFEHSMNGWGVRPLVFQDLAVSEGHQGRTPVISGGHLSLLHASCHQLTNCKFLVLVIIIRKF